MSKLENLVPPLNLCKLIPQGEFADSAFVWREDWCVNDTNDDATHLLAWKVEKRGCFWVFPLKPTTDEVWAIRNQVFPITPIFVHNFYSAPTLQEIMENTPFIDVYINASKEYTVHRRYGSHCREHFRDKTEQLPL